MTRMRTIFVAAAICMSLTTIPAVVAQESSRVKFASGNDNASVEGTIKGKGYHDYLLGARAGQKMSVSLISKSNAYFNILPPGSSDVAIYNSSMDDNDATGIELPDSGDYTIRVYLMGNDEDTGKTANYVVSVTIMDN